jgi:hypothetical protein
MEMAEKLTAFDKLSVCRLLCSLHVEFSRMLADLFGGMSRKRRNCSMNSAQVLVFAKTPSTGESHQGRSNRILQNKQYKNYFPEASIPCSLMPVSHSFLWLQARCQRMRAWTSGMFLRVLRMWCIFSVFAFSHAVNCRETQCCLSNDCNVAISSGAHARTQPPVAAMSSLAIFCLTLVSLL